MHSSPVKNSKNKHTIIDYNAYNISNEKITAKLTEILMPKIRSISRIDFLGANWPFCLRQTGLEIGPKNTPYMEG
jgi:hypothetical protein